MRKFWEINISTMDVFFRMKIDFGSEFVMKDNFKTEKSFSN